MKVQAVVLTTAIAIGAISAHAQPAAPPPGNVASKPVDRIKAADKNGDGLISREEAQASLPRIAEKFDTIDQNRDGQLSKDELRQWSEQRRAAQREERKAETERLFTAADKDNDGVLTREEVKASMPGMSRRFDALDKNQDGKLTREEFSAVRRENQEKRDIPPGKLPQGKAPS